MESEVVDKRPSEKYNGGVITFRHEVENQRGETVATIETKLLIACGLATKKSALRA